MCPRLSYPFELNKRRNLTVDRLLPTVDPSQSNGRQWIGNRISIWSSYTTETWCHEQCSHYIASLYVLRYTMPRSPKSSVFIQRRHLDSITHWSRAHWLIHKRSYPAPLELRFDLLIPPPIKYCVRFSMEIDVSVRDISEVDQRWRPIYPPTPIVRL